MAQLAKVLSIWAMIIGGKESSLYKLHEMRDKKSTQRTKLAIEIHVNPCSLENTHEFSIQTIIETGDAIVIGAMII